MTTGGHAYLDEHQAFEVTKRIIENGRLDIPDQIAEQYWEGSFRRGSDGKLYSIFSPTWSFSFIPFALLAESLNFPALTWVLYGSSITAGICAIIFLFSRKLGFSRKLSLMLVVIFGLTTTAWPYSKTGIGPMLGTFCLLGSIYLLYSHRYNTYSKKWHLIAGSLFVLSVAIRYDYLIFIPYLLLFQFLTAPRDKLSSTKKLFLVNKSSWLSITFFVIPLLILFALIALYNHIIWGSVAETGYGHFANPEQHKTLTGVWGLLISPYTGLFFFAPITLLLPISLFDLYKKEKALSLLFLCIFVTSLFFYGTLTFWYQGHTWGPRYLFSSIPLMIISLGASLELRGKLFVKIVAALSSIGFFVNFLGSLFSWQTAIYEFSKLEKPTEHFSSLPFFDPSHSIILYQFQVAIKGYFDLAFVKEASWPLGFLFVVLAIEIMYLRRLILNSKSGIVADYTA